MSEDKPVPTEPPLAARLMRGTAWTVGMQWGVRLLGAISTIVLVRLLGAEDFGLIAMAMAVITLIDQLSDFGISWALIKDKHAGREEFDTAWTIQQGQMLLVGGLAAAAAPFAADFFNDPRITPVLQVIALSFAIRGFENIGVIEFQRQLQFHRDFLFRVAVKVVSVVVTIGLAIWLRSYWALAFGLLFSRIVSLVLSYLMSPYRPRWTISAWQKIWGFSKWILSQGFARYIIDKGPTLFLGRVTTAQEVGYYSVAEEVATLPTYEVSLPVSRAVLPGFAKLVDEKERLRDAFIKAIAAVATVTIPLGFGLALVAEEAVLLVLGAKWQPAVVLVQIFAVYATLRALDSLPGNLLVVMGKVRSCTLIAWFQAILLVAMIVPAFEIGAVTWVVLCRTLVSVIGFALLLQAIRRTRLLGWQHILAAFYRPAIACAAMIATLLLLDAWLLGERGSESIHIGIGLLLKVAIGGTVYASVLAALWFLAGRPDGIESVVLEKSQQLVLRRDS